MGGLIVSRAELKNRWFSPRFRLRLLLAIGLGYIYGAFGFSLMFALLASAAATWDRPPETFLWGVVGFIFGVVHLTGWGTLIAGIGMLIPTLILLPLVLAAAFWLRTGRWGTIGCGALAGLVAGWPLMRLLYPEEAHWSTPFACLSAGGFFALGLRQVSLRERSLPRRGVMPIRRLSFGRLVLATLLVASMLAILAVTL